MAARVLRQSHEPVKCGSCGYWYVSTAKHLMFKRIDGIDIKVPMICHNCEPKAAKAAERGLSVKMMKERAAAKSLKGE